MRGRQLTFSVVKDVYFLMGLPFRGMALPINPQVLGDEWVGDSLLLGVEADVWFSHMDWGDQWPYEGVHRCYSGKELWILGPVMDHWRSTEHSGADPRLRNFFFGSNFAHPDDGIGELVSTIQLSWLAMLSCTWLNCLRITLNVIESKLWDNSLNRSYLGKRQG